MTNEARTIMADINIPRPCHKSSLGRSARSLSLSRSRSFSVRSRGCGAVLHRNYHSHGLATSCMAMCRVQHVVY